MFSKLKNLGSVIVDKSVEALGEVKEKSLEGTTKLSNVADEAKQELSGAVDGIKEEMQKKEFKKALAIVTQRFGKTGICPCCDTDFVNSTDNTDK